MNPTLQLKILTLEALGRAAAITHDSTFAEAINQQIAARCEDLVAYVKGLEANETSAATVN
jgi:hypothetical protein